MTMTRGFKAALCGIAIAAAPVSAQLPQASASALGFGFNMTASSRGFAAMANNPAGLGLPDSPGFSLALLPVSFGTGIGPIKLADLAMFDGVVIPTSAKTEWLQRAAASGGQAGVVGVGVTPLALTMGSIGFQLSTVAAGRASLSPDAVELLLFGNAGLTGAAGDFALAGSALDGYWLTTAAVSTGFQAAPAVYLGVTAKYTVGNGLLVGRDGGSLLNSSPLSVELDFPMVLPSSEDTEFNNGSGFGLDVGAIWRGPAITLGATIENVINTFEWTVDGMSFVPGQALFDRDTSDSDFDEQPATAAPSELLAVIQEMTIKPAFAAGAELDVSPLLQLRADIRKRASGGMELGPDYHAGVGAELRALPFLPLRAHVAKVSDGTQIGGGLSLVLGPVNLSWAGALRTAPTEDSILGMFTLSFGAN